MTFYPDVEEGIVEVGPYRVSVYDSRPDRTDRVVVLFHGTGGSAESNFWALFPMLAMRARVVAFDFVDPEDPERGRDDYVAQALGVVQSIAPDARVDVVGYSFGAVVAASFAARHPHHVRSLTLVAGWLKTDAHQLFRNELWWRLRESDPESLARFTVFTTYSPQFINSRLPHELDGLIDQVRRGRDRAPKMKFNRSVDIADEASEISAPTLVIACTRDQMVPLRHSQLVFGAIPDARFASVDAGHGVMTERPSEVFAMIDAFQRDPHRIASGAVLENSHA